MTPECALLLACARPRPDPAAIRELAGTPLDWPRWRALAEWHLLAPLAYWRLQQACPEAVPSDLFQGLERGFRANAEYNLNLTAELLEVLRAFEAAGIRAVPYKGPVLAWWLYGNPALRPFVDLDLLVDLEAVPRARELLRARGYRPQAVLDGPLERSFLRWAGELPFTRADGQVTIELHWRLTPAYRPLRLNPSRLAEVSIGGRRVSTFSAEDALALLAAHHGGKHCWSSLLLLCDLARLLEVCRIDWSLTLERVAAEGLLRRLLVGLSLAQGLLGVSLPPEVRQKAESDRRVPVLTSQIRELLLAARLAPSETRLQLRLMERLRDRVRFRLGMIFQPTEADWTALRIPPSLFPLYYLARPVRLLVKHGALQARRFLGRSR